MKGEGKRGEGSPYKSCFCRYSQEVLGRLTVGLMLFRFVYPSYVSRYYDFECYTKGRLLTEETSGRYSIISSPIYFIILDFFNFSKIVIYCNIIFFT